MPLPTKVASILAAALVLPAALSAQTLQTGTWTGTITPPGNTTAPVTFDVTAPDDSLAITINGPFGSLPFSNIQHHPDRLTFTFSPGPPVNCTLMLQEDKSYSGDCLDAAGAKGVIVMVPPEGQPDADVPAGFAANPASG